LKLVRPEEKKGRQKKSSKKVSIAENLNSDYRYENSSEQGEISNVYKSITSVRQFYFYSIKRTLFLREGLTRNT
jgi:hypothetical protein